MNSWMEHREETDPGARVIGINLQPTADVLHLKKRGSWYLCQDLGRCQGILKDLGRRGSGFVSLLFFSLGFSDFHPFREHP